jgi:hypothetical protein
MYIYIYVYIDRYGYEQPNFQQCRSTSKLLFEQS